MSERTIRRPWGPWEAVLCAVLASFAVGVLWMAPVWIASLMPLWERGGNAVTWGLLAVVTAVTTGLVAWHAGRRPALLAAATGFALGMLAAPMPSTIGVLVGFLDEMPPLVELASLALTYGLAGLALGALLGLLAATRASARRA